MLHGFGPSAHVGIAICLGRVRWANSLVFFLSIQREISENLRAIEFNTYCVAGLALVGSQKCRAFDPAWAESFFLGYAIWGMRGLRCHENAIRLHAQEYFTGKVNMHSSAGEIPGFSGQTNNFLDDIFKNFGLEFLVHCGSLTVSLYKRLTPISGTLSLTGKARN